MNKLTQTIITVFFIQLVSWTTFPALANTEVSSVISSTSQTEIQNTGETDTSSMSTSGINVSGKSDKLKGEKAQPSNVNSASKYSTDNMIRFYQKWWFSLLIILLISPFIWKYLQKREMKFSNDIDSFKKQNDDLTLALKEKDNYYKEQEKNVEEKLLEEEKLKFQATGLAKFSELISNNRNDLKKLGQSIICELVEYVGAHSGTIYIANENENGETLLEMLSAYAPSVEQIKEKIHPGEGYVGACYKEGIVMEIDDIPETYAKITSGLGGTLPRYITFIPLLQDDEKLGIIEIASLKKIESYKLEFVKNLSRDVASSIAIKRANEKMQEMLERSRAQAEELQAQEEEMRQNMEEMQATQEELKRQAEINKKMQEDLEKEKYLTDTLLGNIPESIYFKDLESKFIKSSNSMAKLFGLSSPADLIGKSDFDFFDDEHAKPAYEGEQRIIKTGKPIIDLVEKEVKKDGSVSWVTTTKMPLKDQSGKIVGTFGISKDITEQKKMEMDVIEKNEALQAQEEELRQNLEEMHTIQEDLAA